MADLKEA